MTSSHISEVRRRAGALGGRAKAIAYAGRQADGTKAARDRYRQEFLNGTHSCRLGCRPIPLPDDLLPKDRERAANLALLNHLQRMRERRKAGQR